MAAKPKLSPELKKRFFEEFTKVRIERPFLSELEVAKIVNGKLPTNFQTAIKGWGNLPWLRELLDSDRYKNWWALQQRKTPQPMPLKPVAAPPEPPPAPTVVTPPVTPKAPEPPPTAPRLDLSGLATKDDINILKDEIATLATDIRSLTNVITVLRGTFKGFMENQQPETSNETNGRNLINPFSDAPKPRRKKVILVVGMWGDKFHQVKERLRNVHGFFEKCEVRFLDATQENKDELGLIDYAVFSRHVTHKLQERLENMIGRKNVKFVGTSGVDTIAQECMNFYSRQDKETVSG